jgi:hypothetical protein
MRNIFLISLLVLFKCFWSCVKKYSKGIIVYSSLAFNQTKLPSDDSK